MHVFRKERSGVRRGGLPQPCIKPRPAPLFRTDERPRDEPGMTGWPALADLISRRQRTWELIQWTQ
jgi:hypothetical protein